MAKGKVIRGCWADLAKSGLRLDLRVTPGARANTVIRDGGRLGATTTAPPEDGKANAAVTDLLARALGIAASRLTLVSGATSRDKSFRID